MQVRRQCSQAGMHVDWKVGMQSGMQAVRHAGNIGRQAACSRR